MWRKLALLLVTLCFSSALSGQSSYLNRPDLLGLVDSCLRHTYNFSFSRALGFQQSLYEKTPGHPAPLFLEAMIIYWEQFPLIPEDEASGQFVDLMDRSVALAESMMETEQTRLEGIFFDLFARALKAMYWADNGKSGKVVPDLRTMYKHTVKGFDLKEEFNEFYFSTGLYNYYIEVYPEAHPVYKPLVAFMQEGDRELGLVQLNHAINHTVYLKVEATLFMSLIQLKYENDLNTAAIFAEKLYREYPGNIFYQGHLITILLHHHRYDRVGEILEQTDSQEDAYSEMIRQLAGGFMEEKVSGNDDSARKKYWNTIGLADSFGPFADLFKAMGYMGLSRIHESRDLHGEAKRYARKASNLTVYRFILDE